MSKTPYAEVGALMRAAREKRGLTQEQIAERLGRKQEQISKWERGEALPPTKDVRAVAAAYKLAPEQILPRRAA